ncbi:hypothetical protein CABS01_13911 [Colletotrichum abscissum]|uniref:uncharacterized protein n=1 Tax=Colletotrichum abscissum TaxID=1671311 RepID=UPI0027D74384|nr:uncharacterized protein CABS01_13911 [Colletotrichum abscissum]KAK1483759.1 hypothetical protein CABS01_13911 [Colletotrichum abscissum]
MRWPLRNGPCGATKGGGLDDYLGREHWGRSLFLCKDPPVLGRRWRSIRTRREARSLVSGAILRPEATGLWIWGRGVSGVFGDGGRGRIGPWLILWTKHAAPEIITAPLGAMPGSGPGPEPSVNSLGACISRLSRPHVSGTASSVWLRSP